MRSIPGVIFSDRLLAEIGDVIADAVEAHYRDNGVQVPAPIRQVVEMGALVGRNFRSAVLAQRAAGVRSDVRSVESPRSSPALLGSMKTYSSDETAERLHVGRRAVQMRARRGSLPARLDGREWRFDAAHIDKLAKGGVR